MSRFIERENKSSLKEEKWRQSRSWPKDKNS